MLCDMLRAKLLTRMTIAVSVVLLAFICQFAVVNGCPAGSGATNELRSLCKRTSPTRSGGSPPHQPTGLLGDIVTSSTKKPALQHEHTPTGLLGDIVHQVTSKPASPTHPGSFSAHSVPPSQAGFPHVGSTTQSKDKGVSSISHAQGSIGKPSNDRPAGGIGKTPQKVSVLQEGRKRVPWWKQPGGQPMRKMGTGPRWEQSQAYKARKKAKEQGPSGPSSPQKPPNEPKRRTLGVSE
ncbi:unnamed protein product [Sympodiomycopsis kandeliae]